MRRIFDLRDEVVVRAPADRCFLLSTNVELVQRVLKMDLAGGRVSGLVKQGDTVLWSGWKFGLPLKHESLVEPYDRPSFFRDSMIRGRFASFEHDHNFIDRRDGTVALHDELRFSMPFGRAGELLGSLVIAPHIQALLRQRLALIKQLAESEEWRLHVPVSEYQSRRHA